MENYTIKTSSMRLSENAQNFNTHSHCDVHLHSLALNSVLMQPMQAARGTTLEEFESNGAEFGLKHCSCQMSSCWVNGEMTTGTEFVCV